MGLKKRNRRLVLQPARATSPIRHPKTIMNCDFPLTQATTALGMTDGQVALYSSSFRRDARSPRSTCGFPPPPNARSFLSSGGLATPAVRAAPVRAQRQHSSSVAFHVVCSTQRPIVCLSVLPRAVKHPSYAPHRARFSRWLGFGFLGWRTPDLRSESHRPNEQWARNFLRVGRRPTDPI